MLRDPIHGSGNPVPWDVEHGAEHRELLAMLHVKRGDYAHWAVRMDRATRRVTHISAGPMLKARDYRNEVRSDRSADIAPGLIGLVSRHVGLVAFCHGSVRERLHQ